MSIGAVSQKTAQAILAALKVPASEAQSKDVVALVEKAMIQALIEANQSSARAVAKCCSADRDMAHKVAAEIERSHQALIANLSSLR